MHNLRRLLLATRYPLLTTALALCALAQPTPPGGSATVMADASTGELKTPTNFLSNTDNAAAIATALGSDFQPLDADLTSIAALTTTADGRSLLEASALTATGLGLTNGSTLDTWAGLTPSANAQSLVTANYAAMRGLLDLEAGTDFYSISAADTATSTAITTERTAVRTLTNADLSDPSNTYRAASPTLNGAVKIGAKYQLTYPFSSGGHSLQIPIYWTGTRWGTTYDPTTLKPTRDNTYYVDPASGDDSDDGSTWSLAFKSIAYALGQSGDNEIILAPGKYYYPDGWKGVNPAKGITVRCPNGTAELTNEAYPRRWTEDATYPGMYTAPTTQGGESIKSAYDSVTLRAIVPGYSTTTTAGYSVAYAASVAAVQGGAVGFIVGTTTTYCRLPQNQDPNGLFKIYYVSENVVVKVEDTTDATIYLEGIRAEYGATSSIRVDTSSEASRVVIIRSEGNRCRTDNGIQLQLTGQAVLYRCKAIGNYEDGINYQTNSGVSSSNLADVVEIECSASYNGISTSGTNNGSTIHGTTNIIRLNCSFFANQNRQVHDVGWGNSLNVGVTARAGQYGWADFATGVSPLTETTEMWLIDCDSDTYEANEYTTIYIGGNSTLGTDLAGAGTVNAYSVQLTSP